jgi:hypothetical protein
MHDSYAATVYTAWHLSEYDQRRRWETESERYDLAGLIAQGFHQPKELSSMHERFRSRVRAAHGADDSARVISDAERRIARMNDVLARSRFVEVPIVSRPEG